MNKIFFTVFLFSLMGCELLEKEAPHNSKSNPCYSDDFDLEISFVSTGPWGGDSLHIDTNALAVLRFSPPIEQTLSCEFQDSLKSLVDDFFSLDETSYPGYCADDMLYTISIKRRGESKIVYLSACASLKGTVPPSLDSLTYILYRIVESTRSSAPWQQLFVSVRLDTTSFFTNDPVVIFVSIENPLKIEKRFYVHDTTHFDFGIHDRSSGAYYSHYGANTELTLKEFRIQAGERRTFKMQWNQALAVGQYELFYLRMPTTILIETIIPFDIIAGRTQGHYDY